MTKDDLLERLRNPLNGTELRTEAADEIERLRQRLGPRGLEVVEIDGAGHYVNAKVKAEIERLREIEWQYQSLCK